MDNLVSRKSSKHFNRQIDRLAILPAYFVIYFTNCTISKGVGIISM